MIGYFFCSDQDEVDIFGSGPKNRMKQFVFFHAKARLLQNARKKKTKIIKLCRECSKTMQDVCDKDEIFMVDSAV